jgi:hypothetical protein
MPALKTNQQDLLKNIEQYEITFMEKKQRLLEVRTEKLKRREQEESKI